MADNPRVASLRRFIEGWFLSYFIPNRARQPVPSGYEEHLSREGGNLPNVIQYLNEEHKKTIQIIINKMIKRIPLLEHVETETTLDGRLVMRFKDGPFKEPFLPQFISDGTMKMLAYLVLINDPEPPPLLCVEEPENGLHPKLMAVLAEEFRLHAEKTPADKSTQVFISSHSPYFVSAIRPKELWIMERGSDGFAQVKRADTISGVPEFIEEGADLGDLWYENHLGGGNP